VSHTGPPVVVLAPTSPPIPVVVDSPHSGMTWPADFGTIASRAAILSTWDAYVDDLWAGARASGATLVAATFPRAYIDVNRAHDDVDLSMLDGTWPVPVRSSDYARRGMGLIRRMALPNVPMYDRRLTAGEIQARLDGYYHPYRRALTDIVDGIHEQFGIVVHVNAHSMKSRGNEMNTDSGAFRPDVVVSDRRGTTADPGLTRWAADWFVEHGLSAQVNTPYQGGDLVASFGRPAAGRHSIQIELNRALYMDEARFVRTSGYAAIQRTCTAFIDALGARLLSGGTHPHA
jgi:N-formylglutamate deformylase